jgi:hypothetical protein
VTSPIRSAAGLRAVALAVGAAAAVGLLAGCTSAPAPKPTASHTATAAAAKPGITQVNQAPGTGTGFTGALADTKVLHCDPKGSGWTVDGTVTNSSSATADYRIYVSLLNSTGDTRALVEVDSNGVAVGATKDWTTDIASPDTGLSCVLRVERYPSK